MSGSYRGAYKVATASAGGGIDRNSWASQPDLCGQRHKPDLPELGRPISSPHPSGMGLSVASSRLLPRVLSLGPNGDKAPLVNLPMVAKASLRSSLRSTAHLALGLYSQDHYSQGLLLFPRWSSLRVRALLAALYSCTKYHA